MEKSLEELLAQINDGELRERIKKELSDRDRALEKTKALYDALFSSFPDSIVHIDTLGRIIDCNRATEAITGESVEKIVGSHFKDLGSLKAKDIPKYLQIFSSLVRGNDSGPIDIEIEREGDTYHIEAHPSVVNTGESRLIQVVSRDVTRRVKAQEELRISNQHLEAIFEHAPDAIYLNDYRGTFVNGNRKAEEMTGYHREELRGVNFKDANLLTSGWDIARALKNLALNMAGLSTGPDLFTLQKKDGDYVQAEISTYPIKIGRDNLVLGIARDVSKRTDAERQMIIERDKAQKYFDIAGVVMLALDSQGDVSRINEKGSEVLGYDANEIVGENWFKNYLPESDREDTFDVFKRLISGDIGNMEYYVNDVIAKGGERKTIAWHNSILRDGSGKAIGTLSSGEDITERMKYEKRLKESEGRYKSLFNNIPDGILVADPETRELVMANPFIIGLLGYSADEIIGMSVDDIHPPEDLEDVICKFEAQARGEIHVAEDLPFLTKDGRKVYADANSTVITINGKEYLVGLMRDKTEKKKFEDLQKELQVQMMQDARLADIGRLAAGLAHNLNNPLAGVIGYAEMMENKYPDEKAPKTIVQAGKQMRDIIQNMMFVSRSEQEREEKQLNINDILKGYLNIRLGDSYFKHYVKREYEFDEELPNINGVYSDFSQSLGNIIQNSLDAMWDSEEKVLRVRTYHDDSNVYVEVGDTGSGIPESYMDKLFSPFFSTKPMQKEEGDIQPTGTGLGLSFAYETLKNNYDAEILVDSVPGDTKFTVRIPRGEAQ